MALGIYNTTKNLENVLATRPRPLLFVQERVIGWVTGMLKLVLKQSLWASAALASTAALGPHPPPPPPPPPHSSTHTSSATGLPLGPSTFVAPGLFPTSAFKHYYNNPTATSAQPQPVVTDPVLHLTFPQSLTDPNHIPGNDTTDPHLFPPKASATQILELAFQQIVGINNNPIFGTDSCSKCLTSLEIGKMVALAEPTMIPQLGLMLCEHFNLASNCFTTYGATNDGHIIAQVLANTDISGYDGQLFCQNFFSACALPPTPALDLSKFFTKPKPNPLPPPRKPSGKRMKVLHMSDFHVDPRYATSSEANCTTGLCCRANNNNVHVPHGEVSLAAPRYGWFTCDTPWSLGLAALEAIPVLTGTQDTGFDFTLYTGDLVSHDSEGQLSRAYIEYAETALYTLFKQQLGSGPVYAALGNHDSYNQAQDAPHLLGGDLATQFSWNYDHVASLWELEGWLPGTVAEQAKANYAGYSVQRQDGLRIIALNTDLWYRANYLAYINLNTSDPSGMLTALIQELEDAEEAGDAAYIIGHVLSGWDGTNPLEAPTNLFYQIVDRFAPHVIKLIAFGHTHEDQFSVFYTNNGTVQSADTAVAVSWIAPSITPLTNLNSGFRMYEIDSGSFDVLDAYTWATNVSTFPSLDHQTHNGPTFKLEYSTRQAYGSLVPGWPAEAPLNATWWHLVTQGMENNPEFVQLFTTFQGKSSVLSPPCTSSDCVAAKICYMRSGSASIAKQNCITGFGSVQ